MYLWYIDAVVSAIGSKTDLLEDLMVLAPGRETSTAPTLTDLRPGFLGTAHHAASLLDTLNDAPKHDGRGTWLG
jgi:hypothetical protein